MISPAPWEWHLTGDPHVAVRLVSAGGREVLAPCADDLGDRIGISPEDARLIAAAPTMLGLLRRWADTMGADDTELGQETIEFLAKVDG